VPKIALEGLHPVLALRGTSGDQIGGDVAEIHVAGL
jgi:hypothetical protein